MILYQFQLQDLVFAGYLIYDQLGVPKDAHNFDF
jgi:hypothetical protein